MHVRVSDGSQSTAIATDADVGKRGETCSIPDLGASKNSSGGKTREKVPVKRKNGQSKRIRKCVCPSHPLQSTQENRIA